VPGVLYGFETWSLTLRDEHRLRVFENRVLWEIFGAVRVEVTGDWRRLHNEEPRGLYCSPGVIRASESSVRTRTASQTGYHSGALRQFRKATTATPSIPYHVSLQSHQTSS